MIMNDPRCEDGEEPSYLVYPVAGNSVQSALRGNADNWTKNTLVRLYVPSTPTC